MAAVECNLSITGTVCEVQNAAAVQTVRHAALKSTCTGFGRVCIFQSDWTSAPPRPIKTVSPKLNQARPIKIKTKFMEIVVLKPGRRIFIAEPTIASAKNRTKCPRFSGSHREAAMASIAPARAVMIATSSLALMGIAFSLRSEEHTSELQSHSDLV